MVIFKGFYIVDSNGIIVKHYFGKRYRSFHERVRIMRGCIKYWGVTDIVDCGFINRRSPSRKDRPIKWVRVGMTLDAFESICEELEKQGILKEKEHSKNELVN